MQQLTVQFRAMERVYSGQPVAEALPAEVERLGAQRVFLLVSRTLNHETDAIASVREALGHRCAGLYEGMPPHTPRDAVLEATEGARAAGADLLVSIGGGSLTDAAKMVQLCLAHDVRDVAGLDAYRIVVEADGSQHRPTLQPPPVRMVAVPTTLSGGDFNPLAGCTDHRIGVKQSFEHPLLVPRAVILDPAISVHTPEWVWLSTGMRAVDHAVEGLCSLACNPYTEGAARQALRLLGEGLRRSKARPDDLEGRQQCQLGMWLSMANREAGVPMGASHAIGHVLGGTCGVPHGYTSCVMLPNVLRYNAAGSAANAERQAIVAEALGRPGEDAAQVVGDLISALGLPRTLRDVGVGPERFREVAEHSMHDRWIHTNPRPIKSPEEVLAILEMAA
ncbi:MAG TPA: iron-containing alcohol dehydrogenase [bacterium]|nr:iron-containing alcohol dehydrogenase [bacterium]